MKEFLKNLKFIFMPHFWYMNYQYSEEWDIMVHKLMRFGELVRKDPYSITFIYGDLVDRKYRIEVWLGNYPYAYCTHYNYRTYSGYVCDIPYRPKYKRRPSRLTILKFKKFIKNFSNN